MKKIISLMVLVLAFSFAALAQEKMEMKEGKSPTDKDKTEAIPADGVLKRGAALGNSKTVSLTKVLENPSKFANQNVRVEGVIVRSCTMEGCWMELAPKQDAK